ncbi:MAG: hypothetical protein EVA89_24710 [Sandaracinaceae bacterium]|nr:MAG: hypothetical protein EVA89_24710 [Sandaracinaceae bacterium]
MDEEATHPSPHDALFKRVFGDVERGGALLRSLLPEALTRAVDWSTLELRPSESVGPELRGLSSDLVFSGRMADRWVLFHVLVEHQSTPDPRMPYRVAEYLVRLWHSHGEVVDGQPAGRGGAEGPGTACLRHPCHLGVEERLRSRLRLDRGGPLGALRPGRRGRRRGPGVGEPHWLYWIHQPPG